MKDTRVVVIGAGPAGMMAAGAAAENGADVLLIEKNKKVGRKLAITGKGRCNITNYCDNAEFISNLTSNSRFMYSALSHFSCYDTVSFFEEHGLKTKVERGNRVFPESDKALDVVDTLYKYVIGLGVEVLHDEVKGIVIEDGIAKGVRLSGRDVYCDSVIIASGGLSYPATGSTGDGYRFAKAAGHKVTPLLPSLIPLVSSDEDIAELQGLTLKNVSVSVIENNSDSEIYSDFGEMLFTHFGISGPIILSASAHMRSMSPERYAVLIDLKPALDEKTLDKRIVKDLSAQPNKDIINVLPQLLPKSLIPVILRRAGIDEHIKCNAVTSEQRCVLIKILKGFIVHVHSFRPIDEAIVTHGGVDVKDVDPRTMQSKLVDNLYFAGEVLDLDAYTGGFNLQIAYSTGRLAGYSAARPKC